MSSSTCKGCCCSWLISAHSVCFTLVAGLGLTLQMTTASEVAAGSSAELAPALAHCIVPLQRHSHRHASINAYLQCRPEPLARSASGTTGQEYCCAASRGNCTSTAAAGAAQTRGLLLLLFLRPLGHSRPAAGTAAPCQATRHQVPPSHGWHAHHLCCCGLQAYPCVCTCLATQAAATQSRC
jgi:hypothetical protein